MFSCFKNLIVNLVFPHLGFWSGNLFLISPFPDRCLLVPIYNYVLLRIFEGIKLQPVHLYNSDNRM